MMVEHVDDDGVVIIDSLDPLFVMTGELPLCSCSSVGNAEAHGIDCPIRGKVYVMLLKMKQEKP